MTELSLLDYFSFILASLTGQKFTIHFARMSSSLNISLAPPLPHCYCTVCKCKDKENILKAALTITAAETSRLSRAPIHPLAIRKDLMFLFFAFLSLTLSHVWGLLKQNCWCYSWVIVQAVVNKVMEVEVMHPFIIGKALHCVPLFQSGYCWKHPSDDCEMFLCADNSRFTE